MNTQNYSNHTNLLAYANILTILRYSLGDFSLYALRNLTEFETNVFWISWVIIVLLAYIIFLNFLIADINVSYSSIQDSVEEFID